MSFAHLRGRNLCGFIFLLDTYEHTYIYIHTHTHTRHNSPSGKTACGLGCAASGKCASVVTDMVTTPIIAGIKVCTAVVYLPLIILSMNNRFLSIDKCSSSFLFCVQIAALIVSAGGSAVPGFLASASTTFSAGQFL